MGKWNHVEIESNCLQKKVFVKILEIMIYKNLGLYPIKIVH